MPTMVVGSPAIACTTVSHPLKAISSAVSSRAFARRPSIWNRFAVASASKRRTTALGSAQSLRHIISTRRLPMKPFAPKMATGPLMARLRLAE